MVAPWNPRPGHRLGGYIPDRAPLGDIGQRWFPRSARSSSARQAKERERCANFATKAIAAGLAADSNVDLPETCEVVPWLDTALRIDPARVVPQVRRMDRARVMAFLQPFGSFVCLFAIATHAAISSPDGWVRIGSVLSTSVLQINKRIYCDRHHDDGVLWH
jgi:hypothetical protein